MKSFDVSVRRVPPSHGELFTLRLSFSVQHWVTISPFEPAPRHLRAPGLSLTGKSTLPSTGKATVGISNNWVHVNDNGANNCTDAEVAKANMVHSNATSLSRNQSATTLPVLTRPNNQPTESPQRPNSSRSSKNNEPFACQPLFFSINSLHS
ncbi:hypothetical protein DPMN_053766 [Dreissena polymorpha]|uniref:Uncharacterized protein n=1 Tax=Dreissena polymorpha TaxID=45954 RepID=A0A9D4CPE5_DREPO|nr:hypothetical protein DPMN_053766 [Dreissena polymorpha]